MRKLFAHPLCSLKSSLLWGPIALVLFSSIVSALPLRIGALNDFGNVLDRHGRERINVLISDAQARYGIDVSILASWENQYDTIDQYAYAILDSWGLARGSTVLAVFLKKEGDWAVKVLGGEEVTRAHPDLTSRLEAGISDLVAYRRVEEAMVALFGVLDEQIESGGTQTAATGTGAGRTISIVLLIVGVAVAAVFVTRGVCPRCGHILRRRTRPSLRSYREQDVVYYCRHCGYTRTVTRKRGPRDRGG